MKKINWLIVSLIAIVGILALFWIGTMIGGWGFRGYGMMGGYGGHMGWGFSPFSRISMGFGMLFMWFIPIGLIALAVLGVASLAPNAGKPTLLTSQQCPNCGKNAQADWQNCPYCGTKLG